MVTHTWDLSNRKAGAEQSKVQICAALGYIAQPYTHHQKGMEDGTRKGKREEKGGEKKRKELHSNRERAVWVRGIWTSVSVTDILFFR